MKRILTVCLGNICRSPMAEGILQQKITERKLVAEVDSAGTSNYHIGEGPDHRAIDAMRQHQIDISSLTARQFIREDYDRFDLILAMDVDNYNNILALSRNEKDKEKVKLVLNYLPEPDAPESVPDPYFGERDGFAYVYELLDRAIDGVLDEHFGTQ